MTVDVKFFRCDVGDFCVSFA